MADASTFAKIKIGIASPEEIRSWSYGEVKKPETINYRTFKPERDGLFCERIFGPVKDWECHCGRYKKMKFKGIICERCGVEVTRSKVRRERMGHIELAAPVCHVWYLKAVPSPLGLILDISPRHLERVLYFQAYIVISVDEERISKNLSDIQSAVAAEEEDIRKYGAESKESRVREFNQEVQRRIAMAASEDPEEAAMGWSEEMVARKRAELELRLRYDDENVELSIQELRSALAPFLNIGRAQRRASTADSEAKKEARDEYILKKGTLLTEEQYRGLEKLLDVLAYRFADETWRDVVRAGQGGAAIKELLQQIDLEVLRLELRHEVETTQGPKRARAIKRLELVEAFLASRTRPEWMILEAIPVISPELRPMVMLEGGRFAASDLNDLYRRIINRNNRLKRIIDIRAPESIVNHEKRLLQESVDALIDNSRRQRPVMGSSSRPLKSLSDMLKGKEGRFRKNLLGKRVDYSGRSVIVVGPHLKLHQCGLPKEMALELFKPFVMKTLVERGYTTNIKTAKRMIEKVKPEVWDALEEVIREHPVLLNRAPTLHRLGIQAFEPILIEGKAIQIHPLVCYAFNADFDGDQMAVHVPLSAYAQAEARLLMLSSHNLFSPAHGGPIVAPTQDIVLGCYYLTMMRTLGEGEEPRNYVFASPDEAVLAQSLGEIGLHDPITLKMPRPVGGEGEAIEWRQALVGLVKGSDGVWRYKDATGWHVVPPEELPHATKRHCTTVGRLLFNQILPEKLRYTDAYLFNTMNKGALAQLVSEVHEKHGKEKCVQFLDEMKSLGFKYAMRGGITIAMTDMDSPSERDAIIRRAEKRVSEINQQYDMGMFSESERKRRVLEEWMQASDDVATAIMRDFDEHNQYNPIYIITNSGARGSTKQVAQLSGMRGLMTDPFGNLIEDLPIKSNFHEGLSVLEFFVSTHGARKGMADTALRTADAGYLTRRLVDVAQDVIVRDADCGTTEGIEVEEILDGSEVIESLAERILGRYTLSEIVDPITGRVLVGANEEITDELAQYLDSIRIARDNILAYDTKEILAREGDVLTVEQAEALVARGVVRARAQKYEAPAHNIYEITRSMRVPVRSVLNCELRQGVCAHCYGRDLATGKLVDIGVAVGIIAAQSIGEPGTQLTMRTFHTGGVAGKYLTGVANVKQRRQTALKELHEDIQRGIVDFGEAHGSERERSRSIQAVLKVLEDQVRGLLRVSELFEARRPKGQAIVTEYAGVVAAIESKGLRTVQINSTVQLSGEPPHYGLDANAVAGEDIVDPSTGEVIVRAGEQLTDRYLKRIVQAGIEEIQIRHSYLVPYRGDLAVEVGQHVERGDRLTEGPLDPHKVLELQGPRGVQDYLVREIQAVYKAQGVDINDKHIEVIVRQMLRKRKVRHPGDTRFLIGQIVDKFVFHDENMRVRKLGKREATADWVLLSITDAALATESFLSAASFQKTTRVLTDAAVRGKKDELVGLKENVIIGRLIPAGTGLSHYRSLEVASADGTPIIIEPPKREAERLAKAIVSDEETSRPSIEQERYTPTEAYSLLENIGMKPDGESLEGEQESTPSDTEESNSP